jgi:hypothetical protein
MIIAEIRSVTTLATITGIEEMTMPYHNQSTNPVVMITYIASEISPADRERQILINCGRKDNEVSAPATKPSRMTESIGGGMILGVMPGYKPSLKGETPSGGSNTQSSNGLRVENGVK